MPKTSAGILLYRRRDNTIEVLLVHPGGPFWKNKDAGAWTLPKGELADDESPLACAQREFAEELGSPAPQGPYQPLTPIKQKAGKTVHAFAVEADFDPANLRSNTFTMQWPPRSGKQATFPEVDRAAFFDLAAARTKINAAQVALLDELKTLLNGPCPRSAQ